MTAAVENDDPVRRVQGALIERSDLIADNAHVGANAGHRGGHKVMASFCIKHEAANDLIAHPHIGSLLQIPEPRGKLALLYSLDEKLQCRGAWSRRHGIRAEKRPLSRLIHESDGCVLPGGKRDWTRRLHAK